MKDTYRYDPRIHGDPEEFLKTPLPADLRWFEREKRDFQRRSSILTAAFTPFTKEFTDKIASAYPPEKMPGLLDNHCVDTGKYSHLGDRKPVFRSVADSFFDTFERFCELNTFSEFGPRHKIRCNPDIAAPIGVYGEDFAQATVKAGGVLSILARGTMRQEGYALECSQYGKAIDRDTFIEIPHYTLAEGIQTITASIALLMAKGVTGYKEDPVGGLAHLIDQKVFQHFAAHAPSGVIIRMADHGLSFPSILTTDDDGKSLLSPELIRLLEKEKPYKAGSGQGRLGYGCPVAIPHVPTVDPEGNVEIIESSGVQMAMALFFPYLDYFYTHE
jgi:hypothetical protein